MPNNRWILPIAIVLALLLGAGLLVQSQQLSTTQTSLASAEADINTLQSGALTLAANIDDAATAQAAAQTELTAAANDAATLSAQALATQDSLQSSAVTAQATARAALTAGADAAAATQSALQNAASTQAAMAQAALTAAANDAATQSALALATQDAVRSAAATAQANAQASLTSVANDAVTAQAAFTAVANAAATREALGLATQSALQNAAATAQAGAFSMATTIADARATQAGLIGALDTAQVEATRIAAALAERETELQAQRAEIATLSALVDAVPTRPSVTVYEPVAPVEVGALLIVDNFDNNNDNYWYEGTVDRQGVEQGRIEVVDGVYRFSYTNPDATRGLFSSAVSRTQPNLLLEYDFRVLNCDDSHDVTYVETLFYSNQAEEYGLAIFCNQVAWSLIRVSDAVERLGAERFNVSDRMLRQWHTMSLWFTDTEVTFYLDGVRLSSQTLPPDREGFFYLRIYSEDQAAVEFDNIRVWETPPTRRPGQLVPVSTPRP